MKLLEKFVRSAYSAIALIILNVLIPLLSFRGFNFFGVTIVIIGELIYGYNNFIMGSLWTPKVRETKGLVKSGLFKYIRHPLYLGVAIASLGVAFSVMSLPSLIFTLAIVFPYLYYRAKIEEKLLLKTLKGYKEYMKNTGMFLPKISR